MTNKASLVIVNFNRGLLVKEIASIFATYQIIEKIIIIDNNSTDDSKFILKSVINPKIEVLSLEENLGYARGNNVGLKRLYELGFNFAFVVNPDVYFKENVLDRVINAFLHNPQFAVITTSRCDPDCKDRALQYTTKANDTFLRQLLSYSNIIRHYYIQKRYAKYNYDKECHEIIEIAEAPGSFYGVNLQLMNKIGYLDEGTFLYCEELILHCNVVSKGFRIGFISDVMYEHRHKRYSTTTGTKSIRPYLHQMQSRRYFQQKYLKVNFFQKYILLFAEKYSIFEMRIIKWLK